MGVTQNHNVITTDGFLSASGPNNLWFQDGAHVQRWNGQGWTDLSTSTPAHVLFTKLWRALAAIRGFSRSTTRRKQKGEL